MSAIRYTEIARDLEKRIENGEITHKLPTVDTMVKEYKSSIRTIMSAVQILKARRVVVTVPCVGIFLSKATTIPQQRSK